ncbi:hypothetical protein VTI74DRAFT_3257 [Chaetomium olivicolor]
MVLSILDAQYSEDGETNLDHEPRSMPRLMDSMTRSLQERRLSRARFQRAGSGTGPEEAHTRNFRHSLATEYKASPFQYLGI